MKWYNRRCKYIKKLYYEIEFDERKMRRRRDEENFKILKSKEFDEKEE